jgi:AcrR family transcriptional regulator
MTQKAFYSKEMIIEAAFELTQEKGWAAVTAREIAVKLGSSTMPIYSSLKSMEEIERAVRMKASLLMFEYQKKPFTDNPMLNIAIGYVAFARHEPRLFKFLYVERPVMVSEKDAGLQSSQFKESYGSEPGILEAAAEIPDAMQDPLMLKSWIFTHGLASMIAGGVLDLSDERIQALLLEAGGAFYLFDQQMTGKGENE